MAIEAFLLVGTGWRYRETVGIAREYKLKEKRSESKKEWESIAVDIYAGTEFS